MLCPLGLAPYPVHRVATSAACVTMHEPTTRAAPDHARASSGAHSLAVPVQRVATTNAHALSRAPHCTYVQRRADFLRRSTPHINRVDALQNPPANAPAAPRVCYPAPRCKPCQRSASPDTPEYAIALFFLHH